VTGRRANARPYLDPFCQAVTPPEDLQDLASWLLRFREILAGRLKAEDITPALIAAIEPKLNAYITFFTAAAKSYRHIRPELGSSNTAVLAPAQTARPSEADEITTTEAADLTGRSPERMRQMAAAGKLGARRGPRRAWLLDRREVIALRDRQSGSGDGGTGSGKGQRATGSRGTPAAAEPERSRGRSPARGAGAA